VTRHVVRGVYTVVAVVVCPLLAWNLAVATANHGFGWRGFLLVLLAVPVIGAVLTATLLRRRGREATFGAIGALPSTLLLVILLPFVTLSHGGLVTP
jgi:ABC-type sugar transport system permease subunit